MYEPSDPNLAIIHKFLVKAAETEKRMPTVRNYGMQTVWPDVAAERNVDFRPDKTFVTLCKATNRQIDDHALAEEMINCLDKSERVFVRFVLKTAAFRERGPAWTKIAKFHGEYRKTSRLKYEKALMNILLHQLQQKKF